MCNETIMAGPVEMMMEAAACEGKALLYAPGDNELNDCHRDGSRVPPRPADYYKAEDARNFLIDAFDLTSETDVTGKYEVKKHHKTGTIPGTSDSYSCDFDAYLEMDDYAVITLEVLGSQWYLADQSQSATYPNQDSVDPLADRLGMYLNAKDCALEWLTTTAGVSFVNSFNLESLSTHCFKFMNSIIDLRTFLFNFFSGPRTKV